MTLDISDTEGEIHPERSSCAPWGFPAEIVAEGGRGQSFDQDLRRARRIKATSTRQEVRGESKLHVIPAAARPLHHRGCDCRGAQANFLFSVSALSLNKVQKDCPPDPTVEQKPPTSGALL